MRSVLISDGLCTVRKTVQCQHSEQQLKFLIVVCQECLIIIEALCILLFFLLPGNKKRKVITWHSAVTENSGCDFANCPLSACHVIILMRAVGSLKQKHVTSHTDHVCPDIILYNVTGVYFITLMKIVVLNLTVP